MTPSSPDPYQLLRQLYRTQPFLQFCAARAIHFRQSAGQRMRTGDFARWRRAVGQLSPKRRVRVEQELSQVAELSRPIALALLARAARGRGLPPESVPAGAPLALWFLLHREGLFRDVYLGFDAETESTWRIAQAPTGLMPRPAKADRDRLAQGLRRYFRAQDGTGRFCAVESYRVADTYCFVARLSGRPQFVNGFSATGRYSVRPARPASVAVFAYESATGRILLRAHWRAADQVLDLLRIFGRTVLGTALPPTCVDPVFRLDRLKGRFAPAPDAADMESVRVKAVHLVYPERLGRRRVRLETLPGDGSSAVADLLRQHGGGETVLRQLDVLYAELEVRLRNGGGSRLYIVRLWTDRCNLGLTSQGDRLRSCLLRWGLTYAR